MPYLICTLTWFKHTFFVVVQFSTPYWFIAVTISPSCSVASRFQFPWRETACDLCHLQQSFLSDLLSLSTGTSSLVLASAKAQISSVFSVFCVCTLQYCKFVGVQSRSEGYQRFSMLFQPRRSFLPKDMWNVNPDASQFGYALYSGTRAISITSFL